MATHPAVTPASSTAPRELRIVSHSNLFYWWPVWVVGFLLGIVSLISNYQLAAVHRGTVEAKLESPDNVTVRQVIEVDPKTHEHKFASNTNNVKPGQMILYHPENEDLKTPSVGISPYRGPGVIFCTVMLVVILITNIHLRGVWSFVVIVVIVSLVVILSLAGAMDWILIQMSFLDVRISTGGYFLISTVLLILWVVIFLLFHQQTYIEFTPGQFRVKLEIGEGVTAYDTRGMTVHKVRSDFFRHWILGLGSGDLIVRTTGAQAHEFNLQNVLFISQKVRIIEDMIASAGR